MSKRHRIYPFNAEQTVNILSEFGPLVTMFVVNAVTKDINKGTWVLLITTVFAIGAMFYMFRRPPIFPLIASSVTIAFGALTILTGNPMWVQIKVTIFNALFAGFLFGGLWKYVGRLRLVLELGPILAMLIVSWTIGLYPGVWTLFVVMVLAVGLSRGHLSDLDWVTLGITASFVVLDLTAYDPLWLKTNLLICSSLAGGFALGATIMRRNFFKYVFERTFHYTQEGWDIFTRSFAWFFVLTAVANEIVRLTFKDVQVYTFFGQELSGVNIWILFKVAIVMPASGIYAWLLTRWMRRHNAFEDSQPAEETQPTKATEVVGQTQDT